MKRDSQISGILSHLAWLEVRIRDQADALPHQALTIALQAYNAAVMLQWRFTCPLSSSDVIQIPKDHDAVTAMIEALAKSSRKAVIDLKGAKSKSKSGTLKKLGQDIRAAISGIAPLFRFPEPKAKRLEQMERNPDAMQLIREYLDEHEISPGSELDDAGPDAAIHEALAMLAYLTYGRAQTDGGDTDTHRALLRMAKGFLKTAVDFRIEEQDSSGLEPLKTLADAMVADAAGAA